MVETPSPPFCIESIRDCAYKPYTPLRSLWNITI